MYPKRVTNADVRNRLHIDGGLDDAEGERGIIWTRDGQQENEKCFSGEMEGTGKRGRPPRKWLGGRVGDWCQKDVALLEHFGTRQRSL